MRKGTGIKQHDLTDCGAACLASVAAYHGLHLPLSMIRLYASTDRKGTNIAGMANAAEKIGFRARAVKGGRESIPLIPSPSIAHLNLPNGLQHFVVIYRIGRRTVSYMDPGTGKLKKQTQEAFAGIWSGVLLLMTPDTTFKKGHHKTPVFSRFMQLLRPHRNILLQATAGAVLYGLLGLSTSLYVQKIIDFVLIDNNIGLLRLMSLLMLLIMVFRLCIGTVKDLYVLKTGQRIDAGLITGYFRHLLHLPQKFLDGMRTGELISRVNDAVKIRMFINDLSFKIILNFLILVLTFCVLTVISRNMALIIFCLLPSYTVIYLIINRINRKLLRLIMEQSAELESHFVESLGQHRNIRLLGLQEYFSLRTETRFAGLLEHVYKTGRTHILSGELIGFLSSLCTIAIFWAGCGSVISNELTPGELLSIYTLAGYMIQPLNQLLQANKSIQDAVIAADRLFQIIDVGPEIHTAPMLGISKNMLGDIRFQNVTFRYGSRESVLKDFNCLVPFGQTTSIIGESGSGKSTLISLIQRLYPLSSGRIIIGRTCIDQIDPVSLRMHIHAIPQRTGLFSGSVLENIVCFEKHFDQKRFCRTIEQLEMNEFLEKMPDGFNTLINQNGDCLSGGEKQKIALARALYNDPEVLILDEATSSMDAVSEKIALEAVRDFGHRGKTIILISHQVRHALSSDHVILLEKGRASEQGRHQDLHKASGTYSKLCRIQGIGGLHV